MQKLKSYFILCRVTIALVNACAAATGYLLSGAPLSPVLITTTAGVLLLACGASALNQYQEQDIDSRMERTRHRPLPAGILTRAHALSAALILSATGLLLLLPAGAATSGLGLIAVLWYNGLYTWMKKRTAFAAVPGALVGAIPPALGWIAGGTLPDSRLLFLCMIFFLWQVPHFWLLVLGHGDEYRKAGLPALLTRVTPEQLSRVTFVWICATAAATLALPLYGMATVPAVYGAILVGAIGLVGSSARLLRLRASVAGPTFRLVNGFIIFVMTVVTLERLFA